MKNNTILIAIIAALVFGGGGFFAGQQYQKNQRMTGQSDRSGNPGQRRFGGQNGNNRPVAGEILNADDKSITVKMMDGSSKIVLLSDKTQINKAATASKSDLKTGEKVAVFGSENSDGSLTAASIQLNPQFGARMGGTPSASPK